jgi:DNA-binding HxlR family transcriptional regulator
VGRKQGARVGKGVGAQRSAQLEAVKTGSTESDVAASMMPEWREFLTEFPTVDAAVAAAATGRTVELFSDGNAVFRRRVVQAPGGPVVEDRLYPHQGIQDLVATAWLNHPEPGAEAARQVSAFLLSIVPAGTPVDGLTVAEEQGSGPVPVFSYRRTAAATGLTSWEDLDELNSFGPLHNGMDYIGGDQVELTDEIVEGLRRSGMPVRRCDQCGHFVTDRHPAWPGVWVVLEDEIGPVCSGGEDHGTRNDLFTVAVRGPHRLMLSADNIAAGRHYSAAMDHEEARTRADSPCCTVDASLARVFALLGKRWNGLLLAVLCDNGPTYFAQLRRAVPGISERMLADRLAELAEAGVVLRSVDEGPPLRVSYRLADAGLAIEPALRELRSWAEKYLAGEPSPPGSLRGAAAVPR